MANTKNALLRTLVIDRCLSDRSRNYSTQDIMDECNKALSAKGMAEVTSQNTIRDDISAIEERWMVEIATTVNGRSRYYSYKDPNFSIYKSSVTNEQKEKFMAAMKLLEEIRNELFK